MIDCWLPEKCFKLSKKHNKTDFQLVTVHNLVSWTFFGFNVSRTAHCHVRDTLYEEGVYSIWEMDTFINKCAKRAVLETLISTHVGQLMMKI